MPKTLFAISTIALLALLWAFISIMQYVRRARRRRHHPDEVNADDNTTSLATPRPPPPPPPGPVSSSVKRIDWAYYNKDMGDLSDPYQAPRIRPKPRT